jgi:hypothetical protein
MTSALAGLTATVFGLLGPAKTLGLPRMRDAAAESGFSVTAYRRIGWAA